MIIISICDTCHWPMVKIIPKRTGGVPFSHDRCLRPRKARPKRSGLKIASMEVVDGCEQLKLDGII